MMPRPGDIIHVETLDWSSAPETVAIVRDWPVMPSGAVALLYVPAIGSSLNPAHVGWLWPSSTWHPAADCGVVPETELRALWGDR